MIHAVQLDLGHIEGTGNRCGVGTGLHDLVIPDPNLACTNEATPYGESPEAKRPDTVGLRGHTHEHGTQGTAFPTRRRQQDNSKSQLGGRNPSVLPPGIFLDELTGSTLVGRHPARA